MDAHLWSHELMKERCSPRRDKAHLGKAKQNPWLVPAVYDTERQNVKPGLTVFLLPSPENNSTITWNLIDRYIPKYNVLPCVKEKKKRLVTLQDLVRFCKVLLISVWHRSSDLPVDHTQRDVIQLGSESRQQRIKVLRMYGVKGDQAFLKFRSLKLCSRTAKRNLCTLDETSHSSQILTQEKTHWMQL